MFLIQRSIDLGAGSPDSRTFPPIQDLELNTGFVNNAPRNSVQSIDFSYNSTLSNTAETRIARADSEVVEFRGD